MLNLHPEVPQERGREAEGTGEEQPDAGVRAQVRPLREHPQARQGRQGHHRGGAQRQTGLELNFGIEHSTMLPYIYGHHQFITYHQLHGQIGYMVYALMVQTGVQYNKRVWVYGRLCIHMQHMLNFCWTKPWTK